jgi:hypothetical protein
MQHTQHTPPTQHMQHTQLATHAAHAAHATHTTHAAHATRATHAAYAAHAELAAHAAHAAHAQGYVAHAAHAAHSQGYVAHLERLTEITESVRSAHLRLMLVPQEVAVAMADPFGDDDVDFDTDLIYKKVYDGAVALLRVQREPYLGRKPPGMLNPITQNTGGWKIDDEARTYRGIRTEVELKLRRGAGDGMKSKFQA